MTAIVSPQWVSRWTRQSAAQWAIWRESIRSAIYPSGNPTTGADAIEIDWNPTPYPIPIGCSRMDRYRFNDWGGRICSLPAYAYLCHPSAVAVGTCLVWCCGHVPVTAYYTSGKPYNEGVSVVERALGLGWHVLMAPMPLFNFSDDAIGSMTIPVGVTPTVFSSHAFAALESDGGPHPQRLYQDHFLRGTNQVLADLHPNQVILAGHSGGAVISPWLAACDARFSSCWFFSGGQPLLELGGVLGASEWEQYNYSSTYLRDPVCWDHFRAAQLGCALPSRVGAMLAGTTDVYFGYDTPEKVSTALGSGEGCRDALASIGATFSLFLDTGPHEITQARADYMFERIP